MISESSNHLRSIRYSGFTLLELLITVVILSALSAIVVTSHSGANDHASDTAVQSTVRVMQSAIGRYRADHGFYPYQPSRRLDYCEGLSNQFFHSDVGSRFINRLTLYSNKMGSVCDKRESDGISYPFGPYLKGFAAENPRNNSRQIEIVPSALLSQGEIYGWTYNHHDGSFDLLVD